MMKMGVGTGRTFTTQDLSSTSIRRGRSLGDHIPAPALAPPLLSLPAPYPNCALITKKTSRRQLFSLPRLPARPRYRVRHTQRLVGPRPRRRVSIRTSASPHRLFPPLHIIRTIIGPHIPAAVVHMAPTAIRQGAGGESRVNW